MQANILYKLIVKDNTLQTKKLTPNNNKNITITILYVFDSAQRHQLATISGSIILFY